MSARKESDYMKKTNIGIIGCGNISDAYIPNCQAFQILELSACADLAPERAAAKAAQYGIPRVLGVEALIADPEIEIVVNLTTPAAHFEIAQAALKAGKHVYNEKPLANRREEGRRLSELARKHGLRIGCAPETFMGGGLQTCRQLIDGGAIGQPVAATAFMLSGGHENWHPQPDFYYQPGGGPLFDMGPYYLTAMICLLGPIRRVTGSARITFPERCIGSAARKGERIPVSTPTHVAGILDFAAGPIATLITSFDIRHRLSRLPYIEIYGTEGALAVPDPNSFGGPVRLQSNDGSEPREIPLSHGYSQNIRGIGVADMAYALQSGRAHRAGGAMAWHVLDAMQAFLESSDQGRHIDLTTTCERPAPMPANLEPWTLDL